MAQERLKNGYNILQNWCKMQYKMAENGLKNGSKKVSKKPAKTSGQYPMLITLIMVTSNFIG